ncbi:MAG: TetR/AcrR family transcriptional regulator [Bacillota bacterium]
MIDIENCGIKKKRIIKVFIDSATKILKEEGLEKVTIRKVAEIAGYNSATIYNYFDNSNQLVSFAAMEIISETYVQALPEYVEDANDCLDRFMLIWQCFCEYCFENPKLYYAVFAENIGDKPDNLIQNYYSLFPAQIEDYPPELIPMILESDFSKRCELMMIPCIEAGYFERDKGLEINEMIRLLYNGMLSLLVNNRIDYSPEEATEKIMNYIEEIINLPSVSESERS